MIDDKQALALLDAGKLIRTQQLQLDAQARTIEDLKRQNAELWQAGRELSPRGLVMWQQLLDAANSLNDKLQSNLVGVTEQRDELQVTVNDQRRQLVDVVHAIPFWRLVSDSTPPNGKPVLVVEMQERFEQHPGEEKRTWYVPVVIRAVWYKRFTQEAGEDDDYEYMEDENHELGDLAYLKEGWVETNEHEDRSWYVSGKVVAWQPLPDTTQFKKETPA